MALAKSKTVSTPAPHHYVRTIVSGLFGAIALMLVSASILVVWASRTLTDNNTYVQTVGPVIERPELQDFVATKVTDQLLESAPSADLASTLLTPTQAAGKTPEQLQAALRPVIHDSVTQILSLHQMAAAGKSTNQNAHAELIKQLDANAPEVTLDPSPLVDTVLVEHKER